MLTEDQLDVLFSTVSRPYSEQELTTHLIDRELKTVCEVMLAHNFALLQLVKDWQSHIDNQTDKPETLIWRALRPGHNSENSACDTIDKMIAEAVKYGYGHVPHVPALAYAARSTTTLIEKLDALHHTSHIDVMDASSKEFFALLIYRGPKKMSKERFHSELTNLIKTFVTACANNAVEIHDWYHSRARPKADAARKPTEAKIAEGLDKIAQSIDKNTAAVESGAKKIAKAKRKAPGKHAHYSIETQEAVYTIWERERKNPEVYSMSNTRGKHEHAFNHGKADFIAAGAKNPIMLEAILKARTNRLSRSNFKRLK